MFKKQDNYKLLIALIILIIISVFGYFFWIYYNYHQTLGEVVNYQFFKKVDSKSIETMSKLRSCGNWPILINNPNTQRGDPFIKKEIESPPVLFMEDVECLPVNLK